MPELSAGDRAAITANVRRSAGYAEPPCSPRKRG